MSKEKVEGSPLRRKMIIGAPQPEAEQSEQEEHTSVTTSKHKDTKAATETTGKIRTTIYISEELVVRLKIYVAHHRGEDQSKVIARLLEEFLDGEE